MIKLEEKSDEVRSPARVSILDSHVFSEFQSLGLKVLLTSTFLTLKVRRKKEEVGSKKLEVRNRK